MVNLLFIVTSHGELGVHGDDAGLFLAELSVPYMIFARAGFSLDIASPKGGVIPIDPTPCTVRDVDPMMFDAAVQRFCASKGAMKRLHDSIPLAKVQRTHYDGMVLVGGYGALWDFSHNSFLALIISHMLSDGRMVAALSHGTAALMDVRATDGSYALKGRTVCAPTFEEEEIRQRVSKIPYVLEHQMKDLGATHCKAPAFSPLALADHNLITGQNTASAAHLAQLILDYFHITSLQGSSL
ncbi:MAG: type 1 glutamine amidotransferase domain-containing protein [Alphaproteobacteria bacterium]|nr:MAG: type 1 glutamine amidotransferase domain-containing protein [Alphaproteobacteria bacterium]TAF14295.1 MAG: type 1 glutamine amidotransferase domain-containing protein [Alphaproteobacteria bacterium]TAF40443.1 MAG: type 1 glutamine amidotransferase domain-containing protein [Alphaproteobacteria bacterium]TAF76483.1 MAG: type 1 glutamine amidotransferase domain-containing protein [Alphaproteobacteria bacterium]